MKTFRSMAVAIVALGLAGCGTQHGDPASVVIRTPATSAIPDVTITSVSVHQGEMDSYPALTVQLRVKNPTDRAADYFVTLEYVDRTGTRIDVDYSAAEDVGPGQVVLYERAYGGIEPGDLHGITGARLLAVDREAAQSPAGT